MKKLKKTILILAIIAGFLAAIIYGGVFLGHRVIFSEEISRVPTIEAVTDGIFTFGSQAHPALPESIEEYATLLSAQLKRYNEIAPNLWFDNALVEQSIIVEEYRKGKFWHISHSEHRGTVLLCFFLFSHNSDANPRQP